MEKVKETFDKLDSKAKLVEEAMLLIPHRCKIKEKLKTLRDESDEAKHLGRLIESSLEEHEAAIKKRYDENSESMKRVQMKMMHLLLNSAVEKQPGAAGFAANSATYLHPDSANKRDDSSDYSFELATPRLPTQYKQQQPASSARKKTPIPVFQAMITEEEFASVPAYIKGRTNLAEFQGFINEVLIRTFNFKYGILAKDRSKMKLWELNLRNDFDSKVKDFEGTKFITAENIVQAIEKGIDRKGDRFIQMLRYLQVIREARKNSDIYYIWKRNA